VPAPVLPWIWDCTGTGMLIVAVVAASGALELAGVGTASLTAAGTEVASLIAAGVLAASLATAGVVRLLANGLDDAACAELDSAATLAATVIADACVCIVLAGGGLAIDPS
jgi:hypothetical protein